MKTPLVPLLLLSLAGNAVLAYFVLRPAPTAGGPAVVAAAPVDPVRVAPAAGPAAPAASPVAAPVTWQVLKPDQSLHGLVANLRAAGFPPSVVRAVVSQMMTERLDGAGVDHLPFWKQNPGNPEYLAAQQQLSLQRREMLEELLGADARPSATMTPAMRERRYGQLSDEKIDRIETMTREYSDLRTKLFAERKTGDGQSLMATQAAVEQEMRAELATILSPAELEQYDMRSSTSANRLMSSLRGVDVNESEYTELFRAQKAFDAADPLRTGGAVSTDTMAQRNAAQDQLNEQARAVLTDDRFYEYLKAADSNYARIAQFTANHPTITPAMTYDLTRIEREYQSAMMAGSRNPAGGTSAQERMALLTAARTAYQEKVNTLLGPEIGAAYAQRNRPGGTTVIRTSPGGG